MSDSTDPGQYDAAGGASPPPDPLPWILATIETGDFAVGLRIGDEPHVRYSDPDAITEIYESGATPGVLLYRPHHLLADPNRLDGERSALTVGDRSYAVTSASPICDLVTCEEVELVDRDVDPLAVVQDAIARAGGEHPGVVLSHGYRQWSHIAWFSHIVWFWESGNPPSDPNFDPPPGFPKEPDPSAPTSAAIGLIDNGVDQKHSWMSGGKVTGADNAGTDAHAAHGTMVAGVLRQGAPGSTIHSKAVRVSNQNIEETKVIRALCELRDAGVTWVVMAFGGENVGEYSCLEEAIDAYSAAPTNGQVVAAAGNLEPAHGTGRVAVAPASYGSVYAVACGPVGAPGTVTDYRGGSGPTDAASYYDWSNGGEWVDFVVNLDLRPDKLFTSYLVKGTTDRFAGARGTSLATPLVAAHLVSGRPYADQAGLV